MTHHEETAEERMKISDPRPPGSLPPDFLRRLDSTNDVQVLRDLVTEALLHGAGLCIAREGEADLDSRLRLTAMQRRRIRQVQAFGYRVKLIDGSSTPTKGCP